MRWIHIESPRTADRDWLQAEFGFHSLDLEDVYSATSGPSWTGTRSTCSSCCSSRSTRRRPGRILTVELDLFMGKDYLITLPSIPLPPLNAMFERLW